ncbi:MAG: sulfurtransferase-like selenium metabolism protein YedF [[Clostridium] aminophilum]|uniref:sulfurtransferase-like selenium metabolism protein YedF n=1 Tax=[Clostridium] aminophilum TaxID=1526 RepID=UPI0026EF6725|nr:sulfurtransferase-like selenium metabolism protein YedF [[Clostridium] aminophilum]MDD6196021.1 sulfurtransferase-like selenium metabolism protein YedF [[Clostridium] aminophilum]
MKTVNAMGEVCPVPIVMAKQVIRELNAADTVEVLVDNPTSVENLTKMAVQMGYPVRSEKKAEGEYRVEMDVPAPENAADEGAATENPAGREEIPVPAAGKTVVVVASDRMGEGDDELGTVLIKAFTFALTQQDALPDTMLFYNGGAKLTCEGSPVLEDLKKLEESGVEILTCGTCLGFYEMKEKLAVGSVSNMYEIVEKQMSASRIIRP